MVKKEKQKSKEKEIAEDKKSSSVSKRKRNRKTQKASRYAGAVLFAICLVAGFLLWVGGEMREAPKSENFSAEDGFDSTPTVQNKSGVIIIE